MLKTIQIKEVDEDKLKYLESKFPHFSPFLLKILLSRGLETYDSIKSFLNPKLFDLPNPFLINDMSKAVKIKMWMVKLVFL